MESEQKNQEKVEAQKQELVKYTEVRTVLLILDLQMMIIKQHEVHLKKIFNFGFVVTQI